MGVGGAFFHFGPCPDLPPNGLAMVLLDPRTVIRGITMLKHLGFALGLCLATFSGLACAQSAATAPQQSSAQSVTNGSTELTESGSYVNKEGYVVHRPSHTVSGNAPAGASAQCRDGSYSFSMNHRGTCSHHGGVSRWL